MRSPIKPLLLFLLGLSGQAAYSQSTTIVNLLPSPGQVVGDTVSISVWVRSPTPFDSVSATVTDNSGPISLQSETRLTYSAVTGFFSGRLLLTGMANNPFTMNFGVFDSLGNLVASSAVAIVHHSLLHTRGGSAPLITITQPLSYSVARPVLHFQAKSPAIADSSIFTLYIADTATNPTSYGLIGQYLDSIDTQLDLTAYQGKTLTFVADVTDRNSQQSATSGPITVFVESSPTLAAYFSATGNILDFNYNKLLVVDNGAVSNPRIVDVLTGVSSPIPFGRFVNAGFLTPQGAVFGVSNPIGDLYDTLYDYNNGTLSLLAPFNKGTLKVAGGYGIWTQTGVINPLRIDAGNLFLRNFSTGINTLVAPKISVGFGIDQGMSDVAANGLVAYEDSTNTLFSYLNNVYTQQSGTGSGMFGALNPLTDGNNILYSFVDLSVYDVRIAGVTPVLLTDFVRGYTPQPGRDYQINSKNIAFVKINANRSIPSALWLWDSLGNATQVTSNAYIDLLNAKGEIMFDTRTRELALRNGQIIQVSSVLGRSYYRDSSWYVAIGRTLFKVDFSSFADTVSNSAIYVGEDSTYSFKSNDFTGHFSGPGQLATIKIIRLPVNGVLNKAGVAVQAGDEVALADLGKLSYTPNGAFLGMDTLQWNGSNGIAYTPSSSLVVIRVIAKPPVPQLTGLDTGYCIHAGLVKIKIGNLPDTSGGGAVQIRLDGGSLTLTAADTSFSFNTTTLTAGAHSLIVSFSNVAGISADTQHFNIQAAVVPVVQESANILHVTNLTDSVKLTATDVSEGGSSPLYTFASDGGFVNILQSQGSNNGLTIAPGKLAVGNNWIYVKMQTSASCYTVQYAVDSVNVVRDLSTGIIDVDFPGQVIGIFPNPFTDHIAINGLNPSKKYFVTLFRANGQMAFSKQVENQTSLNVSCAEEAGGVYILSIYDEKRNRVLGTIKLVKTF